MAISKIWRTPMFLPYVQPPLTDEMIQVAEKRIGYKLPAEFVDLLRTQNGGMIRYAYADTAQRMIMGIGPYYPSFTEFEWLLENQVSVSFELKGLFPIDGDGHWSICLDFRTNKTEPEIIYIDIEGPSIQEKIAKNFKEYLGLLTIANGDHLVIETPLSLEESVKQVEAMVNIGFEDTDPGYRGYTSYRAAYEDGHMWFSPNKVPKGFVPENNERYHELAEQMQSTALQHPEIPQSAILVETSFTKGLKTLITTLTNKGLVVKQVKDYFS